MFGKKPVSAPKMQQPPSVTTENSLAYSIFQRGWVNHSQLSFGWVNDIFSDLHLLSPFIQSLNKNAQQAFLDGSFLYAHFQRDEFYFPYFWHWGWRASAGLAADYEKWGEEVYAIPVSVLGVISFQFFPYQTVIPFFTAGYTWWSENLSHFSDLMFQWGGGVKISFALLNRSLYHTLPDEYEISDMGLLLESLFVHRGWRPDEGYIIHSVNLGVYFYF